MKRRTLVLIALALLLIIAIAFIVVRPGDQSRSCMEFYAEMDNPPAAALEWCQAGEYFAWESTLPVNETFDALHIFHVCQGNPDNPAILMIHGYPTMSFDYADLMQELGEEYYVCALDTPGYGFSDKPKNGYEYSIFDDARLVDEYIRQVIGLEEFALLTHDKGDSVGLALLQIYQTYDERPYTIEHHFITNGNIYLPLAQLTTGQKALLSPTLGRLVSSLVSGDMLASELAEQVFARQLPQSEIDAYASIFDYQAGNSVQHDIIKYLNERTENEIAWLETLERSDVPATIIWGELDAVAPVAVPDYVWAEYLQDRDAPAAYWRIPCADHYLQVDEPELIADILRATLVDDPVPSKVEGTGCQAAKIH
ncbi:MAG: alpha/beta fold hydrolase [Anaerolineae bacterium]|nr:alpha/beta fold hydrolase [Anaerolineae bacterium]